FSRSLLPPLPPPSTLFPYTTLFRSFPSPSSLSGLFPSSFMSDRSPRDVSLLAGACSSSVGPPRLMVSGSDSRRLTPSSSLLPSRSEEHTSELQSRFDLVCRLLLEKK